MCLSGSEAEGGLVLELASTNPVLPGCHGGRPMAGRSGWLVSSSRSSSSGALGSVPAGGWVSFPALRGREGNLA